MTVTTRSDTAPGWTVDDTTFGARLALIRQHMDWNIKEAAIACGVPAASWRSWERGGSEPRRYEKIARQIAARTGCSYPWLAIGPDGGGGTLTGRYLPGERVLAAIGADPVLAEPRRRPRIPGPRRPVRRKDHNRRDQRRPASPVAI